MDQNEVITKFTKLRKTAGLVFGLALASAVVIMGLGVFLIGSGIGLLVLCVFDAAVLAGAGIYLLKNYRCPSCGARQMAGNSFQIGHRHCATCGIQLRQ